MKATFTLIALVFCCAVSAQTSEKLELIKAHVNSTEEISLGGIQVNQFLDNCIYEHRCGHFAGGAIGQFGIFKGLALTIDRRLRCNQLSRSQFLPIRVGEKGLIKDHWNDYKIETE